MDIFLLLYKYSRAFLLMVCGMQETYDLGLILFLTLEEILDIWNHFLLSSIS